MRRLLAAAGAAALGLALVVPLARADVPDGNDLGQQLAFDTPTQQGRPCTQTSKTPCDTAKDGAVVYDTDEVVTAKAHISSDNSSGPGGGLKGWDVRLVPVAGGAPSTCHEDISPDSGGRYPDNAYINCQWDTTRAVDRTLDSPVPSASAGDPSPHNWHLVDHGPSVNGKYMIQVVVYSAGQKCGVLFGCRWDGQPKAWELYEDSGTLRWRQVWVNNDVAAPSGVNASFDPAAARINVTWAANPEPDVSYLVQEKVGDGNWGNPITVPGSSTNYVRAVDTPGKYQYQVAATRPAPTADSGQAAAANKTSAYVAAQAPVSVDKVSPPTTAGPNGSGGTIDHSGDNGVLLPTDPTQPNGPNGAPASAAGKGSAAGGNGRPGSNTSGGARSSGSSGRPAGSTGSTAAPGEAAGEGPDSGFSATLPFQQQNGTSADGLGSGSEVDTLGPGFVKVPKPQDARAVLIPMAVALVVFMLAMQLMVWVRRRPAMAPASDDFDDWMGF